VTAPKAPNLGIDEELKRKLLFTLLAVFIYRVGAHIVAPGVNAGALQDFIRNSGAQGFFNLYDTLGGGLYRATIFALGIMPYISASIIFQLAGGIVPSVGKMQKEEEGRKRLTQWTRYLTIFIAFSQAYTFTLFTESIPGAITSPGFASRLTMVFTLTTGAIFVMWLGEQITERGIGNGISLIIFAGIVVRLPSAIFGLFESIRTGNLSILSLIMVLVFMAGIVALIVFVERAQRRIPVQYAKRVVGRRVYGGQNTYLPLRVNTGGVIPIIFAISILQIPYYFSNFVGADWMKKVASSLSQGQPLYVLLYGVGILFFCYFYTSIVFNPVDTADNMRKYGGFIPGIRPGKKTADYIDTVLSRLTIVGAVYLTFVALLPEFLSSGFKVQSLPWIGPSLDAILPKFFTQGFGFNFYFGGTSLLIVVGVAMDTVQQVESKLVEHHYTGFLKKSRIRGRRG
jgi:preprotein translocase subunit SecY